MKMKSKPVKSMPEFKGSPKAVAKAMKLDRKSDKAIARKTGTKAKH